MALVVVVARAVALVLLCRVAAGTRSHVDPSLPNFPGVDFFRYGYNILRGEPLRSNADPGWARAAVFAFPDHDFTHSFSENGTTWRLPAYVSVDSVSDCDYTPEFVVEIHDERDLQSIETSSTSFDTRKGLPILLGYEFSASKFHRDVFTSSAAYTVVAELAVSSCVSYATQSLLTGYRRSFTPEFLAALEALPGRFDPLNPLPFLRFVERFGTHVPVAIGLGQQVTQLSFVAKASLSRLHTQGTDVSGGFRAGVLLLFGANASGGEVEHLQDYLQLEAEITHNVTTCKPRCPPQNPNPDDFQPWLDAATLPGGAVAPVNLTLMPLHQILTQTAIMPAGVDPALLSNRSASLGLFLNSTADGSYCSLTTGCARPPRSVYGQQGVDTASPRFAATAVLVNTTVVRCGGYSSPGTAPLGLVETLDLASGSASWQVVPSLTPRAFAASGVDPVRNAVVVAGGVDASGATSAVVESFTLGSSSWAQLPAMPTAVAMAAAAVVGNSMFVFGGAVQGGAVFGGLQLLNFSAPAPSWTVPNVTMPVPVSAAAVAVLTSAAGLPQIVVAGGFTDSAGTTTTQLSLFDPASMTWRALPPLPAPRARASAQVACGKLLVLGGVGATTNPLVPLESHEQFDPATRLYAPPGFAPFPSYDADSVEGFVFGGVLQGTVVSSRSVAFHLSC